MKWESLRPDPALNQRQNGNKINTAHACVFRFSAYYNELDSVSEVPKLTSENPHSLKIHSMLE